MLASKLNLPLPGGWKDKSGSGMYTPVNPAISCPF